MRTASFALALVVMLIVPWGLMGCRNTPSPLSTPTATARPQPIPHSGSTPTPQAMTCDLVAAPPRPDPRTYLQPHDHLRGEPDAAVLLVMYGDFQCEGCAALAAMLQRLQEDLGPEQVAVVYRHFPLAQDNDKALLAAQAAEAAARQGAFWTVHDALYARQAEWRDLTSEAFRAWMLDQAPSWGLDSAALAAALDDPDLAVQVRAFWEQGLQAGLRAVPTLFVNGRLYTGPPVYPDLRAVVALEVLAQRQFHRCPPWVLTPGVPYRATLHTNLGPVVLVLEPDHAPLAVNSFVFLAQQGWYDHTPVYRVEPGRAVFLGDPSGTGYGHAGYFFRLEWAPTMRYDTAGVVGLVNDGPNTNGSRFFVTLGPRPALEGLATRFGRVVQGLDLLQRLPAWDPWTGDDAPPLWVQQVQVELLETAP